MQDVFLAWFTFLYLVDVIVYRAIFLCGGFFLMVGNICLFISYKNICNYLCRRIYAHFVRACMSFCGTQIGTENEVF